MGHNPATRDVKNSERKQVVEKRTPDEIIKTLRNNLTNTVTIMKSDIGVLLAQYDLVVASLGVANLAVEQKDDVIVDQQEKLDRFWEVYEQENRSATVALGENMQLIPVEGGLQVVPKD